MSMSTHVVGYRAANDTWKKMLRVWESCTEAGIEPPKQVVDFFNGEDPREKSGIEIEISSAVRKIEGEAISGLEVDLEKLPPETRYVRFYNSW